jgi:cytochrome P450
MVPSSLVNARGLVAISPGPLLGSTLALMVLWAMRHGRERRLSWTSTPLPPRGHYSLPTGSSAQVLVRVGLTPDQPAEGSPAFNDWVFSVTTRFHGKPWLLHVPGHPDVLVVSSPVAFEDIQRTFAVQFGKSESEAEGLTHDAHGGAIAFVGTGHLRPSVNTQRQLAASVLGSPVLRQQASVLVRDHLQSLLKVLEEAADAARLQLNPCSNSLDVAKLMRHFAMQVFTELGFGLQLSSELEEAVEDIQERVAQRSKRPSVVWKLERLLDVGAEAALSRSIDDVNAITVKAVAAKTRRRRGGSKCASPVAGSRVDMLGLLLGQKCSSKSSKDPEFLAQFVLGLVVAASEAMAHTLSKCLQCLAQNPDEQEKLLRELDEAERAGKDTRSVVRLEAVVKETLRLHPAKPLVRRRARLDTVLSDGTFVAAGTEVAMDLYSMARRESVWGPGAAEFRPQRWIDSTGGKLRPASTYKLNAFLGGPRACLGADMAVAEIKTVVAAVIAHVRLNVTGETEKRNGKDETPTRDVPCDGAVRVEVRPRRLDPPGPHS